MLSTFNSMLVEVVCQSTCVHSLPTVIALRSLLNHRMDKVAVPVVQEVQQIN